MYFFLQICVELDIAIKKLTIFQMTIFDNNVRFTFVNLRADDSAVRLDLGKYTVI